MRRSISTLCITLQILLIFVFGVVHSGIAHAVTVTDSHDTTITATVYGPPPTVPAIITYPTGGSTFSVAPIVIRGTCGAALTVKVFNNGVLIGTTTCAGDGTFAINATLSAGSNVLSALNYDFQDQPGPISGTVTVTIVNPANTNIPRSNNNPTTGTQPTSPNKEPTANQPVGSSSPKDQTVFSFVHSTWLLTILCAAVIASLLWLLFLVRHKRRRDDVVQDPQNIIRPN